MYVVRDGKAQRVEVKLGVSTADRVEILPRGPLPARVGEQLVIQGVQRLVPGAKVKVVANVQPVTMAGEASGMAQTTAPKPPAKRLAPKKRPAPMASAAK